MAYRFENDRPDFAKSPDGLLPAVVQDADTQQVLMLGYLNEEALRVTRETGLVTFFSRSKNRLWQKGETSGNTLRVTQILLDCDQDAVLLRAMPNGPVCHTGSDTCWGESNPSVGFLRQLERVIRQRKTEASPNSYTAQLFAAGIPKIAQKVGEEAVETIIEALGTDENRLLNESADLLFHLLVLWGAKGIGLSQVESVLRERHGK